MINAGLHKRSVAGDLLLQDERYSMLPGTAKPYTGQQRLSNVSGCLIKAGNKQTK